MPGVALQVAAPVVGVAGRTGRPWLFCNGTGRGSWPGGRGPCATRASPALSRQGGHGRGMCSQTSKGHWFVNSCLVEALARGRGARAGRAQAGTVTAGAPSVMLSCLMPAGLTLAVRFVHALYVGVVLVAPFALAASALLPARREVVRALRLVHLATVAWGAWQLALGLPCPLTEIEAALAGQPPLDFLPSPSTQPLVLGALAVHLAVGLAAQRLAARALTVAAPDVEASAEGATPTLASLPSVQQPFDAPGASSAAAASPS